jgi:uncharacterized membrane protein YdbT with pleckstrin-like domain
MQLMQGEKVLARVRRHWSFFLSIGQLILGVLSLGLIPYLRWVSKELILTNRRVILKSGLLARESLDLDLRKMTRVDIHQGLLQRVMGCGTVSFCEQDRFALTLDPIAQPKNIQTLAMAASYGDFK